MTNTTAKLIPTTKSIESTQGIICNASHLESVKVFCLSSLFFGACLEGEPLKDKLT